MADIPEHTSMIAEAIQEQWGSRCPDFDEDCACCQVWAQFDRLTRQDPETIRQAAQEEALRHLHDHFPGSAAEFEAVFARALKEARHG